MGLIEKFIEFEKPKKDETSAEVMGKAEAKKEKFYIRTLGNPFVAAEAQRIYNPSLPPTKPKGPTEAQMSAGTTSAMDTQGNWGKPERTE